jgi:glyoxylase-like metal-dependent hydrolase (beta-lactamase superfamily II)
VSVVVPQRLTRVVHRRLFNCYLVLEDDGLTLVDTGPRGAAPAVLAEVRRLEMPLRRILLTHAHEDHVAGVDPLARATDDDLEIIVGRREAALLGGDFSLLDDEPEPAPKRRSYGSPSTSPTRLVDEGDEVGSLRIISTPGHTPGHLSALDTRDRTLIVGDALTTLGRTAVSGDLVWRWPFPALSTWNKTLAIDSARRLLEERPARLASGHGPIIDDAPSALEGAISRAR